MSDTNCNWCILYSHQMICAETGRIRNDRTGIDYPNYTIIKIGQNTEKSPGNLLSLEWKTFKIVKKKK